MRSTKRFSLGFVRNVVMSLLAVLGLSMFGAMEAVAQSTGTNTVTLVTDNITNTANVGTPIVIGLSIVFIVWRLIKRIAAKAG